MLLASFRFVFLYHIIFIKYSASLKQHCIIPHFCFFFFILFSLLFQTDVNTPPPPRTPPLRMRRRPSFAEPETLSPTTTTTTTTTAAKAEAKAAPLPSLEGWRRGPRLPVINSSCSSSSSSSVDEDCDDKLKKKWKNKKKWMFIQKDIDFLPWTVFFIFFTLYGIYPLNLLII